MTHREKSILAKIGSAVFSLLGIILILVWHLEHNSAPSVIACAVIAFSLAIYAGREDRKERDHERQSQAATEWPPEEGSPPDDR